MISQQTNELSERIASAEGVVKALVEEYEVSEEFVQAHHAWRDEEAAEGSAMAQQHGENGFEHDHEHDRDETYDDHESAGSSLDERFRGLEEEVATLVADVHDLALYTKLNFTGFVKIVKVRIFLSYYFRMLNIR